VRRALALVACLLAVAAGCSAGTPAPTVTPAPVPDSGEATGAAVAPGVSQAGVTDPVRLETAHRRALADTSFRRVTTVTVRQGERTVRSSVETVRADTAAGRYNVTLRERTSPDYSIRPFASRIQLWGNGSLRLVRFVRINEVNYRVERDPPESAPVEELSDSARTAALLDAFAVAVAGRGDDGYRLRSTRLLVPAALDPPAVLEDVNDASLMAVVTERGVVRRYRVRYEGSINDEPAVVVLTGRITGVGATTVETPGWAGEAVENGTQTGPESP